MLFGAVLVTIAGLGTGSAGWPMRLMRRFRFEQFWFVAMLVGLIVIPWTIVLACIPQPFAIYREVGWRPLVGANLLAIAWGAANVLAGICALRIGFTLSGSILTGVGLTVSVITPMLIPTWFPKAPGLFSAAGGLIVLSVAVILLGVVFSTLAGFGRERVLKSRDEPPPWASGGFLGGLILAVIAGVLSAGMQLANAYGHDAIVNTMKEHHIALVPSEMSFWAAGLFGGALVNVLYPAVLMTGKRSWNVLRRHWPEMGLSLCLGCQLMLAFALFGYGRTQMGEFGDSQAPGVQLAMQIIGGLLIGILAGEWSGVPGKPRLQIAAAIAVLVVGVILMTCAKTLVPVP
jgi:hypothetical protein